MWTLETKVPVFYAQSQRLKEYKRAKLCERQFEIYIGITITETIFKEKGEKWEKFPNRGVGGVGCMIFGEFLENLNSSSD